MHVLSHWSTCALFSLSLLHHCLQQCSVSRVAKEQIQTYMYKLCRDTKSSLLGRHSVYETLNDCCRQLYIVFTKVLNRLVIHDRKTRLFEYLSIERHV